MRGKKVTSLLLFRFVFRWRWRTELGRLAVECGPNGPVFSDPWRNFREKFWEYRVQP